MQIRIKNVEKEKRQSPKTIKDANNDLFVGDH